MYNSYHFRCSRVVPLWCKSPHTISTKSQEDYMIKNEKYCFQIPRSKHMKKEPKKGGGERKHKKRGRTALHAGIHVLLHFGPFNTRYKDNSLFPSKQVEINAQS